MCGGQIGIMEHDTAQSHYWHTILNQRFNTFFKDEILVFR